MQGFSNGVYGEHDLRPNRSNAPPITVYFVRDDDEFTPHKLSCMFCKRTIADSIKGRIDHMIDGPMKADEYDFAMNLQCKLCGQKWRILSNMSLDLSPDVLQG